MSVDQIWNYIGSLMRDELRMVKSEKIGGVLDEGFKICGRVYRQGLQAGRRPKERIRPMIRHYKMQSTLREDRFDARAPESRGASQRHRLWGLGCRVLV